MRIVSTLPLLVLAAALGLVPGCAKSARAYYHDGEMKLAAQDFGGALVDFDKTLELQPDSVMAMLGKAKAHYGLGQWKEALDCFELFLGRTEGVIAQYRKERQDAEFYRDRCRQELGETIEQHPRHIPPPPMGE